MSSNEGDKLMSELRKYLMLMAILAATVTYVAGLNPPGAVWLKTEDGHLTGNQILVVTNHVRYNAFYYSNDIAFMASVVVILLLLLERSVEWVWWLFSLRTVLVLDLLALMVAYAAGSSRGTFATAYASALVSAVSIYAGYHITRYFGDGGPGHAGVAKERTTDEDETMKRLSKILMVFAVFAATVTYTAGLNPPGGFWPDSQDGHRAGDPVLQDFHHRLRYMAFFICNSAAFAASLVAVMLLTTMNSSHKEGCIGERWRRLPVAYWFVLVALLGLLLAYAFGSSRKTGSTVYVMCLELPVVAVCIILQFVLQKFGWEYLCKFGRCIEGCLSCCRKCLSCCCRYMRDRYLSCCCSRGGSQATPNIENTNEGLEQKEKKLKEKMLKEKRLKEAHALVLLLGTLAATITYQAGLNPPGGFWPDNRDDHKGGDPILLTTHARRYKVFFYCNSVALVASVVVVSMVLSRHLRTGAVHRYHALEAAMILDLLSLVAAYAVGCCRDVGTSLRVIALAAGVLVYILIHMVFFTLEHHYSNEEEGKMKKKRKLLLLLAILAATITYQAGLTPPGAFWLEDGGSPAHAAGYAVLADNYPRRYTAFFYCNATSFVSSIAVILLLVNPNLYKFGIKCKALYVCSVAGLFGLAVAYAAGSSRHMRTSVTVIVVLIVVSVFVMSLIWLLWFLIYRQKEGVPVSAGPNTGNKNEEDNSTPTLEEGLPPRTGEEVFVTAEPNTGSKAEEEDEKKVTYMYTTRKYVMLVAILVAGVTYQAGLTPPGGVWPDSIDGHFAGNPVLRDSNERRYRFFYHSNSVSFLTSVLVILLLLLDQPLFGSNPKEQRLPITNAPGDEKDGPDEEKKDGRPGEKKDGPFGMGREELLTDAQGEEEKKDGPGEKKKKKDGPFGMGCEELLRVAQSSLLLALLGLLFAYAAGCSREWETSGYVFALVGGVVLYIVIHVLLSSSDEKSTSTVVSTQPQQVPANTTANQDAPGTAP